MTRVALLFLLGLFAVAFWVTSRPIVDEAPPPTGVQLTNVTLTLYPEQDPEATWRFAAAQVVQDPATREATITGLKEGARYLGGKLDLTLKAPQVVIDRLDNLRVPYAEVYIPSVCWTLNLGEAGQRAVEINQVQGYRAPSIKLSGPGISIEAKNLVSDFRLDNPSWKVVREEYTTDGVQECPGGTP